MKKYLISLLFCSVLVCSIVMMHQNFFAAVEEIEETVPTEEAPEFTQEEQQEYEKIASKNAQAKQVFNDLKLFAAVLQQLTQLIPQTSVGSKSAEDIKTGKTEVRFNIKEIKELLQAIIGSLYNVAELGLGVIDIEETHIPILKVASRCLSYTDYDLQQAAAGKNKDTELLKCLPVGCRSKRGCVARVVKTSALAFKTIWDNAVVSYDPETGVSQRGLAVNVDFIIKWLLERFLAIKEVKEALEKKESTTKSGQKVNWLQKADAFMKKLDQVRTVALFAGQTVSWLSTALLTVTAIIDPTSITDDEMGTSVGIIKSAMQEKMDFNDDALDTVFFGDSEDDII